MISVVITAGGTSSRFKGENKLLFKINDEEVIKKTVNTFLEIEGIKEIIISANKEIIPILQNLFSNKKIIIIEGGQTRQQSVFNGLKACNNCEYVLIHDGARPFIDKETIKKTIQCVKEKKACIVAVKTIDTIKIVNEEGVIISTPERKTLWNAQTPQAFDYKLILNLHKKYNNKNFTDDALLCEEDNIPVSIVEGKYENIKITTLADIKL